MEKESIVFYKSFYEAIKNIPKENQIEVYNAIFEYAFNNKEIKIENGISMAMFTLMKPNIDSANARYTASVENGKKGGRPKKENLEKTQQKPNKNLTITQAKPKQNLNVNDNDNVNDNVNVNNNNNAGDSCGDGLAELIDFYNNNIGAITPHGADVLKDYLKDFKPEVIIYAMQISVEANKRSIQYIKAILNNWVKSGVKNLTDAKNESSKQGNKSTEDEWSSFKEKMKARGYK